VASALLCCSALLDQEYAPAVRIVDQVDASRLVTLKGNTHPYASTKNDRGRVSSDLPMTDLILVLSRDAAQQAAFDKFVASQYEQGSANYHHWLTAEDVGQMFGPAASDIAAVTSWLTGSGFSVDEVAKDRMSIRFSGTAGQVESAFHTEIHSLEAKGVPHIGNMSDPQIPAALTPAVVGVKALHNFFARPQHHLGEIVTRDAKTGTWERVVSAPAASAKAESASTSAKAPPQFGITVGSGSSAYVVEDVTPYDFAKIYNVLPLWNASTPIDGTGQTIAIAGTSSIKQADVTTFRTTFGLPTGGAANTPQLISGNSSPVTICSGTSTSIPFSGNYCNMDDQFENALDVEWSGGVAKGAQIVLVSSYPTSVSDDALYDSENYIIQNKATLNASVMSVSYGLCELGMGTAGNTQYNTLWQTAAAEGIAVFVSTGDQGSAVCDAGMDTNTPYAAQYGLSVNGLASTPYNTAVGGTDLNWGSTASPYWSTSNASSGLNALSYIPEVPWNDTCTNPLALNYLQQWAAVLVKNGYNATSPTDAETACNFVVNWWSVIYQNTSPTVDISSFVDITGGSGGASACTTSTGTVASCSGGYAKPSWQAGVAGIPSDGKRDLPDVSFFASNGFLGSAYLVCVSANGSCTYSATSEPTSQEVGGTSASSPAMAGVMALINQKAGSAQGNPNAELYALAANQTYANCTTESVTNSSSCYFNDIDTGTIAVPCASGSPNCTVSHSGDSVGILTGWAATTGYDLATGLGSLNVANVVNAWPAAIGTGSATVTVTPSKTSLPLNQSLSVAVTVASSTSGGTTPTGTVTLTSGSYSSSAQTLSSGAYTFTIPANSLTVGTDTLKVTYSGDSVYATGVGTSSVTVTQSATYSLAASTPSAVSRGGSTTSTVTVTSTTNYSGTITLGCTLTTSSTSASYTPTCAPSGTVVMTNGVASGTATLTISTTAATSELVWPKLGGKGRGWTGAAGGTVLAFLVLLGVPRRKRNWLSMLGVLVMMVALGSLAGCGGGGSSSSGTGISGTTAGTYTFTVTGTGNDTASTTATTTFTVTVN
jgi:subtilase family serine protease